MWANALFWGKQPEPLDIFLVQQSAEVLSVHIWSSVCGGTCNGGSDWIARIQPAKVIIEPVYSRRLINNKPGVLGGRWRVVRC